MSLALWKPIKRFQSTPPARGATVVVLSKMMRERSISIHAPREGGDILPPCLRGVTAVFQSTPPARGATVLCISTAQYHKISIHAPREGGDDDRYKDDIVVG